MGKLDDTLATLAAAKQHVLDRIDKSAAIVFYSGGKESRAAAELAVRTFDTVVLVSMYLIPGLQCFEQAIGDARTRYGLEPLQYPHWSLSDKLKADPPLYRFPMPKADRDAIPDWHLRDVFDLAIAETGIPLILDGAAAADGLWRRRTLKAVQYAEVFHPVEKWLKVDTLSFLASAGIPLPDSSGRRATGIDLSVPSLLWMHDKWPEDFKRICEVWPLAEAVVWRRRFHGVE